MSTPVRRVVTGHNDHGKSLIVIDAVAANVRGKGPEHSVITELWETTCTPADNTGNADAADRPFAKEPKPSGSIFRIVEYPPDRLRVPALLREQGGGHGGRHPGFHKTNTVDYAIVLSGEIYAVLDESETLLRTGDVLVQRGTDHAWSNRSDEPARVAFIMVDARPV